MSRSTNQYPSSNKIEADGRLAALGEKKDAGGVLAHFNWMVMNGIADKYTFSIAIIAAGKINNFELAERAFQLAKKIDFDAAVFNSFICVAIKFYQGNGGHAFFASVKATFTEAIEHGCVHEKMLQHMVELAEVTQNLPLIKQILQVIQNGIAQNDGGTDPIYNPFLLVKILQVAEKTEKPELLYIAFNIVVNAPRTLFIPHCSLRLFIDIAIASNRPDLEIKLRKTADNTPLEINLIIRALLTAEYKQSSDMSRMILSHLNASDLIETLAILIAKNEIYIVFYPALIHSLMEYAYNNYPNDNTFKVLKKEYNEYVGKFFTLEKQETASHNPYPICQDLSSEPVIW